MAEPNLDLAILGAGESGVGAALLAKKLGLNTLLSDAGPIKSKYKAVLEQNGIAYEENGHSNDAILAAKEVIKSPGIPDKAPLIKTLRAQGTSIISEIEFAARHTQTPIIAITGSNGKTTTTLLVHHILTKAGIHAGLGGNVGTSFAKLVAEGSYDYFVLEVSSFQLDDTSDFHPHIAILTNITPDHLDRYNYQMENYVASKFRIGRNQTAADFFIYCADDEETIRGMEHHAPQAQLLPISLHQTLTTGGWKAPEGHLILKTQHAEPMNIHELALQGKHNAYNSMAAGLSAKLLNIRKEVIRESLADFENVEHRLEPVLQISGIEFINDSKATNVNSTWYALESMTKPVIWIVGGVDKGNDYSQLTDLVRQKVKAVVCLGSDNEKLVQAFKDHAEILVETNSMEAAVKTAYNLGTKGDAVLLSPACASFDLFENYEDRGRQFKNWVRQL